MCPTVDAVQIQQPVFGSGSHFSQKLIASDAVIITRDYNTTPYSQESGTITAGSLARGSSTASADT